MTLLKPHVYILSEAFKYITVGSSQTPCFNATQTITVAGNGNTFVVQPGGSATFIAGQNILFLPGTTVETGGSMLGIITTTNDYCGAMDAPLVAVKAGIDENPFISGKSTFRLYPNPTTDEFTLEMTGNGSEKIHVEIYGIRGDRVLTTALEGQDKYKLSLSEQPVGVYFVRMTSGRTTETLKIVKE